MAFWKLQPSQGSGGSIVHLDPAYIHWVEFLPGYGSGRICLHCGEHKVYAAGTLEGAARRFDLMILRAPAVERYLYEDLHSPRPPLQGPPPLIEVAIAPSAVVAVCPDWRNLTGSQVSLADGATVRSDRSVEDLLEAIRTHELTHIPSWEERHADVWTGAPPPKEEP